MASEPPSLDAIVDETRQSLPKGRVAEFDAVVQNVADMLASVGRCLADRPGNGSLSPPSGAPGAARPNPIRQLHETQWKILQVIAEYHSRGIYPKIGDVAKIVGCVESNITHHLPELQKRGLMSYTENPGSHGEWNITDAGHRFIDGAHRAGLKREDYGSAVEAILGLAL